MSKHVVEVTYKFTYEIDTEQYGVVSIEEAIQVDMDNFTADPLAVFEVSEGHSPIVEIKEIVDFAGKDSSVDGE